MRKFPALFVSHGAPTLALAPGDVGRRLAELAGRLARPGAILAVSAHWDTEIPAVGAAIRPPTIHDFRGFPAELYGIRYPALGSPGLALDVRDRLEDAGFPVRIDLERGLDHGAWVPLRLLYPDASIPVVPLSIQSRLGPAHHLALGRTLAPLSQDVLIVASGSLTHNLRHYQLLAAGRAVETGYVGDFRRWSWERVADGDLDALLDYRRRAPGAEDAHPTDEHLLPLFVALGAAGAGYVAERLHDGVDAGTLAMDSFALWPGPAAAFRKPAIAAGARG